jgi:hypothetical protein
MFYKKESSACATAVPAPAPTVKKELITDAKGSLPSEKTETPETRV